MSNRADAVAFGLPLNKMVLRTIFALTFASSTMAQEPTFDAGQFLNRHCLDCHGADAQEGGVAFHELESVTPENAELWKRIWEQVALKEMPPPDEDQPSLMNRLKLSTWITGQLQTAMKDKGGFHSHLRPDKGNHLDHDLLFGPIPDGLEPPSTPARIWRIHPIEHLTRLNELITREPEFNAKRPGLRAHGDAIGPNREGEVKVYYGLDRLTGWVGGTAAYAAAITGFSPMLATEDYRGLRNYADMYSVNGPEATQIAGNAEDILRFMIKGPTAEPWQFVDNPKRIDRSHLKGDIRGTVESLAYGKEIKRPLTPVYELMQAEGTPEPKLRAAVGYLFEALTCRPPTKGEFDEYTRVLKEAIKDLGKDEGVILGLTPIFLDQEALFRTELAANGKPDEHGRVMLEGHELTLTINSAFSYISPDTELKTAANSGRLKTHEDVEREVERILNDDRIRKPRVLQFFREYFDYDRAGGICKDTKALRDGGGDPNMQTYLRAMNGMSASTDRLVELVLAEDTNVLAELLTTDRVVYDQRQDTAYFGEYLGEKNARPKPPEPKTAKEKRANRRNRSPKYRLTIQPITPPKGEQIHVRVAQVVKGLKSQRSLTSLPKEQRRGILTHPSWLVSHSDAMDNHAIHRGRWIRERLLGGAVPDIPITVDAMLPDEPKSTLRHRMRVTKADECWRCHQKMDPLGLPFEMFNHVGLYREVELEKPVDTVGEIINSGDKDLDGPVKNAIEMIDKLAKSERVEQVFVRHAFRFWMGRNETINDAPVLQAAWKAYHENAGSMKALLKSLLTSDAFLYRKRAVSH